MYKIYRECPCFETENFLIRKVEKTDATDLLECYSDPKAQQFFNSNNCDNDFKFTTLKQMQEQINFWLYCYEIQGFVRFSIVSKKTLKAIGTIEIFDKKEYKGYQKVGILRVDIASPFETNSYLKEIIGLCISNQFYQILPMDYMQTYAIPEAKARVEELFGAGFLLMDSSIIEDHNYIHRRIK